MRLAVITDTHVCAAAQAFNANAAAALAAIDAAGVDLVLHLGDATADGVARPDEFTFARSTFDRSRAPVRYIPGNHDIGDNPADAEPTHEPLVEPRVLEAYRAAFGEDRWCIQIPGWSLIGLNSQLFGRDDALEDAQFDWLAETLASATGRLGLFVHKPLFRDAPDDGHHNPRYTPARARQRLIGMLAPHDWRLVISGHVHQWRRHTFGGVEHVWVPSTAFTVPDVIQGVIGEKTLGFLILELRSDGHAVALERPSGIATTTLEELCSVYPQVTAIVAQCGQRALS